MPSGYLLGASLQTGCLVLGFSWEPSECLPGVSDLDSASNLDLGSQVDSVCDSGADSGADSGSDSDSFSDPGPGSDSSSVAGPDSVSGGGSASHSDADAVHIQLHILVRAQIHIQLVLSPTTCASCVQGSPKWGTRWHIAAEACVSCFGKG